MFAEASLQNDRQSVILIAAGSYMLPLVEVPMKTMAVIDFFLLVSLVTVSASAVEVAQLAADNWDELAPAGKEVDCIYGDYVLRNDKIVVVIAEPLPTRNANLTVP